VGSRIASRLVSAPAHTRNGIPLSCSPSKRRWAQDSCLQSMHRRHRTVMFSRRVVLSTYPRKSFPKGRSASAPVNPRDK